MQYYGTTLTEDVREIDWTGGNLPDDYYDEFTFVAKLPDKPGAVIYFPVIQQCAKGESRWIEIPAQGQSGRGSEAPGPGPDPGSEAGGRRRLTFGWSGAWRGVRRCLPLADPSS